MSTAIVEVQTAVAEFDKVAAGLAELQKQYGGVVFDVATTKGMDEAKAARASVREPRYEIERVRKAAKAPILKLGKELDDRAKQITADILKIEEPIDEQIKNEEARKEAEKQAKIAAELKRVADLQERVAELRGNRMLSPTSGAELIAGHIGDVERIAVDESFQEFREQAEELRLMRVAQQQEAEAQRKRIAEEEAAAKAVRDAEAAKLAAERAEFEGQQAAARKAKEEEERVKREQARLASIKKPADDELLGVVAKHYNVPASKVIEWILAMDLSKDIAA